FVLAGALDLPGERQAGARTDSGVNAISVEATALASADRAPVSPRCVGVREPLALGAVLADEPLAVRVGGEVRGVDGDVAPVVRKFRAKPLHYSGEVGIEERPQGAELRRESI